MHISRGFDPDPLAPAKHQVLVSDNGREWTVIGESAEPIELLKLNVSTDHAIGFSQANVMIIEQKSRTVEASFDSYMPHDGDSLEARMRMRDRWMDRIFAFLLPARLYEQKDNSKKQKTIRRWFKRKKITMSTREDGAVQVFRNGELLAAWGA